MTPTTLRWRAIAPFLAAGFVAYGAFRLLIRPGMVRELQQLESEVAEGEARLAGDDTSPPESGESPGETRDELARLRVRIAALSVGLAKPSEAEAALRSLGALASDAGVRFLRFAPEPEVRLDGYLARAVSVQAEGSFFNFLGFFEQVSLLPHLVLVEDIGMEVAAGGLVRCRFVAVAVRSAEAAPSPVPMAGGDGFEKPDAGRPGC